MQHNDVNHGSCSSKGTLIHANKNSIQLVSALDNQSVVQRGWCTSHQARQGLEATSAAASQHCSLNVKLIVLIFLVGDEVGW